MTSERAEHLPRTAFHELVWLMGGAAVLRTVLDGAAAAIREGHQGVTFGDACEDEPPTFTMAIDSDTVAFQLGQEPGCMMAMAEVEQCLAAAEQAAEPPFAA